MKSLLTATAIFSAAASFVPALAAAQVAPGAPPAADQPAPATPSGRVVRFILPVATGSGVDTITRAAAPGAVARRSVADVVVENQPGAGGVIGTSAMIRRRPTAIRSAWSRTTT